MDNANVMSKKALKVKNGSTALKVTIYVVCIVLAILSILPFWIMFVNATRSTVEIQSHAISLIPSNFLKNNWAIISANDTFVPMRGFINSFIIATGSTICSIYFSTLTAYAIIVYEWKLKAAFYNYILAVMMIPGQVVTIGFFQMVYKLGFTNNILMLILPGIAAPMTVFYMRQYMVPALSMEIIQAARIDGAKEFYIFNRIALPLLKPAIATQAIFAFVASWNSLFTPMILLAQDKTKYTMPMMVSQLRGDIYKTELGSIYLGLSVTVLPLFIVYFALSKYIIAGVALGGVKG